VRRCVGIGGVGMLGFLLVLLGPAQPSSAGTLTVQFNLDLSSVFIRPPMADPNVQVVILLGSGSAVLTIEGINEDGVPIGDSAVARLSELTVSGATMLSTPLLDLVRIERDTLTQNGVATGVFAGAVPPIGFEANARLLFDTGAIVGQHDADSQCLGSLCAFVALLGRPDMPFQNAAPFALSLSATVGDVLLLAGETDFPFRADGGPMTSLQIAGIEVSRNFVPEPSELGLIGLAALGAAALLRSRSRRG
jgi:hypothetical protein